MIELLAEIERNREESITRKEFLDFAQKSEENFQKFAQRTEEQFQMVWKAIGELTEAQKRTEVKVELLAEA